MSNLLTIQEATHKWLTEFNEIPGDIFSTFAKVDGSVYAYDSELFRITASPYGQNAGSKQTDTEETKLPPSTFPCAWSTLFSPKRRFDQDWISQNSERIAALEFFVFESYHFGYLLGIDGSGFDFHKEFWVPLYKLRGLQWHESNT